jgi:carbon-monoxide dehydrogenase large subunit
MTDTGIGASVRRKEDYRFLTGNGRYLDDMNRPGQAYAYFLRSPHAHATFTIDTAGASKMPGVVAVYTGADIAESGLGGLICGWTITGKSGEPHKAPAHPLLALDTVRHVGDTVAVVIADSYHQAKSAAEQVVVDYKALPAVTSVVDAVDSNAPQVHPDAPGNICYDWELGDKAATDAAFESAHHVTKVELVNNRVVPSAIEPRAALGEYDVGTDELTLYTTSQNPHVARLVMSAFIGLAPEHKLRVVAPDIGGGFGSKIFIYLEEVVTAWAARNLKRPVKWTAERSESFMTDCHGRDHVSQVALALDKDGKFLGLRVSTLANMGAYLSTFSTCVPTWLYGTLMQGQYTTGAIYCEVKAVFTHSTPVDAVRGAGRPEATYVVERVVEEAAREMNIDSAELRQRNFIPADAFPYQTQVALEYDSGNYAGSMGQALDMGDYQGFARRREASEAAGKLRGIGGRRCRSLRIGAGALQSHRQRGRVHRLPQPRPGARDDLRAAGLRSPGRPHRKCRGGARRHRQDPLRHGYLRIAFAGRGRFRNQQSHGQDHCQGQKDRGPHAGSGSGRHRVQGWKLHRRGHRQADGYRIRSIFGLRAAQLSQ